MTRFDQLFATHGVPALFEQYGEDLVYYPRTGLPRPVRAMVKRFPPEETPGMSQGNTVGMRMEVEVLNDPRYGISSGEIDTGGDELLVASRLGATDPDFGPKKRSVFKLLGDSGGMTKIDVR